MARTLLEEEEAIYRRRTTVAPSLANLEVLINHSSVDRENSLAFAAFNSAIPRRAADSIAA